ncbi:MULTISPECIES: A24 family peptidase [Microbacterium]|uniref:prepilin peptidase n=1 Tax=Microbacterium TaxID=33882 RepID=UPI00146E9AD4|nr:MULTISPECIES: A24 family peptidase [Microbacterium]
MAPLDVFLIVTAAVFGLVIGSFLNVVVYRVPAGISLTRESRCPHCDHGVEPWENVPVVSWILLRGRCAHCDAPISARYPVVEASSAVLFGAVAWVLLATTSPATTLETWATGFVAVAYLYLAAVSIALTLIDFDTHRLPNSIVLPSYLVAGVLFVAAAALGNEWAALLRALVGMVVLYGSYALLRLIRPGAMGGGDVKLAGVLGLYLGWVGWGALAVGAFAAFLIGGVVGVVMIVSRQAGRKTAIPFGPYMLIGAWTGIFAGEVVGAAYMNLYSGT